MEIHLLEDIVIIFALATLVIFLFHRIRVPAIVGFLITGILAGPYGFGLVQSIEEIEILAEIGVVLLLFTIGIEFSLKNLIEIRRVVFLGGFLQVMLTMAFTYLIVRILGRSFQESLFMGFLVALSSTAVVLKVLQNRADVSTTYGRTSVGILIYQDLIIVPMILLIPILAGETSDVGLSVLILVLKGLGVLVVTIFSARFLIPKLLHQIARTQNQELFLLAVLVLGFAIAWMTSALGLSLALGAFLAGLTISESDYNHQAFGNIIPFRDIFTSFFFVSIGMLLNLEFFFTNPFMILAIALGVLLVKSIIAGFVTFLLGFPFRTTLMVGLTLSQVGEFSFILSKLGLEKDLMSDDFYQIFLSVAIITMSLTPFIIAMAPGIADRILRLKLPIWLVNGLRPLPVPRMEAYENHLVIVGCGVNGKNVARAARIAGINYLLVDNDADRVRKELKDGEPVVFGDASMPSVLKQVRIEQAEVIVVAIAESASTFRITEEVRKINQHAHIIVRTRYIQDVQELYKMGANEVIPEEYETSVEIFTRVLNKYLIPRDEIEKLVAELRSDGYETFRSMQVPVSDVSNLALQIPNIEITGITVAENSPIAGQTVKEIRLRSNYGVTILALRREGETITNPDSDVQLCKGDVLFMMGEPYSIATASHLFREDALPGSETGS